MESELIARIRIVEPHKTKKQPRGFSYALDVIPNRAINPLVVELTLLLEIKKVGNEYYCCYPTWAIKYPRGSGNTPNAAFADFCKETDNNYKHFIKYGRFIGYIPVGGRKLK